jgi:hypothetical protein
MFNYIAQKKFLNGYSCIVNCFLLTMTLLFYISPRVVCCQARSFVHLSFGKAIQGGVLAWNSFSMFD